MDNLVCATARLLAKGIDDNAVVPLHRINFDRFNPPNLRQLGGVAAMREIGGRLAMKYLAAMT
jgi:hypothetical protein